MSFDTAEANSPQCRSTDPLTSRLSALRVNTASCDRGILNYLCEEGPANTYVISQMIERKETTVSSALSRLRRENKVHEAGMDESSETGHQRIIWAYGPSPSGAGPERKMPVRQTGPQKPHTKFKPFTVEEILQWNKQCGYADIFTEFLNQQVLLRIT